MCDYVVCVYECVCVCVTVCTHVCVCTCMHASMCVVCHRYSHIHLCVCMQIKYVTGLPPAEVALGLECSSYESSRWMVTWWVAKLNGVCVRVQKVNTYCNYFK